MSELEPNLPPDQLALLLCQEFEVCIRSYLPQEDQSDELDPKEEVEQKQVEPKVDQARDEAALQLYNRSIELLKQQGFEEVLIQALSDNWHYYSNLFLRSQTTQMLDVQMNPQSLAGGEETTNVIRGAFDKLLRELHQGPLVPPQPQDYLVRFPSPYDDLFAGVFLIDTLFERARYVEMRETFRQKFEGRLGRTNPDSI